MKKAILLVSHGSFSAQAKKEITALSRILKRQSGFPIFESAFLEINHPDIKEGIRCCAQKGATEITVLLNFLNSGVHVLRDIEGIVKKAKKCYPFVSFFISPPIGIHKKIPGLFLDSIKHRSSLKKI